jgi:catechol 2,3-dioxygenase-like lactoylglutathione lyase family enzyme
MHIDHVALWTNDIERCKKFYVAYFGATAGTGYVNPKNGFESCFLSFADGARIEAMKTTVLPRSLNQEHNEWGSLTSRLLLARSNWSTS